MHAADYQFKHFATHIDRAAGAHLEAMFGLLSLHDQHFFRSPRAQLHRVEFNSAP
jgi:hypothetical protein